MAFGSRPPAPRAPPASPSDARGAASAEPEVAREESSDPGPREDGRVRRAREQKLARRAQILAAARRLFAERGFHATSMADLLAAADIARGTFYLHFDGKEAAFQAVLDDLLQRIRGVLRPVDTTTVTQARAQLESNLARAFALFADDPDLGRLLFRQSGAISAELDSHLDAFFGAVAALAQRSLTAGQALGLVRPGEVALMARLALGLFKEAAQALDEGHPPESLAREVLDLVLHGVLTGPRVPPLRPSPAPPERPRP